MTARLLLVALSTLLGGCARDCGWWVFGGGEVSITLEGTDGRFATWAVEGVDDRTADRRAADRVSGEAADADTPEIGAWLEARVEEPRGGARRTHLLSAVGSPDPQGICGPEAWMVLQLEVTVPDLNAGGAPRVDAFAWSLGNGDGEVFEPAEAGRWGVTVDDDPAVSGSAEHDADIAFIGTACDLPERGRLRVDWSFDEAVRGDGVWRCRDAAD